MSTEYKNLQEHQWKLSYDKKSNTAKMINEKGEIMDLSTFSYCLDALQNEYSDQHEKNYGSPRKEPLDEFTMRRLELFDYRLIEDQQDKNSRSVFEVYSDSNGIFTLDSYRVINNRKLYRDFGFQAYLNRFNAEKVFDALKSYLETYPDLPGKD